MKCSLADWSRCRSGMNETGNLIKNCLLYGFIIWSVYCYFFPAIFHADQMTYSNDPLNCMRPINRTCFKRNVLVSFSIFDNWVTYRTCREHWASADARLMVSTHVAHSLLLVWMRQNKNNKFKLNCLDFSISYTQRNDTKHRVVDVIQTYYTMNCLLCLHGKEINSWWSQVGPDGNRINRAKDQQSEFIERKTEKNRIKLRKSKCDSVWK